MADLDKTLIDRDRDINTLKGEVSRLNADRSKIRYLQLELEKRQVQYDALQKKSSESNRLKMQ